jgi:hypothetical protein
MSVAGVGSADESGDAAAVVQAGFAGMGPVHNELTASDVAGLRAWFVRDNRTGATSVLGLALLAAFGMLGFGTLASGDSVGLRNAGVTRRAQR